MIRQLRLVTRKSALALWQARHVAGLISAQHADVTVTLVEMSTEGDRFLSAPLAQAGGKGLFVKELEQALLDGRADLAVHSLKDMTAEQPAGLTLASVPEREDPRDAWVSPGGVAYGALTSGMKVGTSSLRRTSQLCAAYPGLLVMSLRGNVQTRLEKTREQNLAGTVLALAGLKRLGLEKVVTQVLEPEGFLPSAGQGALALQCRGADSQTLELLQPLEHAPTRTAITAERACLAMLEGGCSIPLAAYATLEGTQLRVRGLVGAPDGRRIVRAEVKGPPGRAQVLGEELARALLEGGAGEILAALRRKGT